MIKAILLDLDNTLITNPINRVGQNIATWESFFREHTGLPDATTGLTAALRAVLTNQNPVESNVDVFYRAISQHWQVDRATATGYFTTFYQEAFPRMEQIIQPRPEATVLLHWLWEQDFQVAIATNPTYSIDAILQRMAWGDLPTDRERYALITHIENTQFAKPTPHYYEEILGRLGIANEEALMVGDDWENDIIPAARAGLNTFWVREDDSMPIPDPAYVDGTGTLSDLSQRIRQEGWLNTLTPRPLQPEMIIPRLLGNVGALFGVLREHAPERWWQHPDPGEWSPLEVICHLRDTESTVQRPRLERIAREDNPFLTEPQTPPGPGEIICETEHLCDPAEEFAADRQKTVAFLQNLPPEAWQRPARHSIFGPTNLLEMANFTATHDRLHLQQICQTIGRCE